MTLTLLLLLATSVILIAIVNYFKMDNLIGEVLQYIAAVMLTLISIVFIIFAVNLIMKAIFIPIALFVIVIVMSGIFITKEIKREKKIQSDKCKGRK